MRYLISTACDQKFEDFLINDWLRSLKDNVDLSNTDILVLDFGLSENARNVLMENNVMLKESRISGKIVNARFAELTKFLRENPQYEQILMCDSGDLIFQRSISNLFEIHSDTFKVVCEDYKVPMDVFLMKTDLPKKLKKEIKRILSERKMINAGFLIGPKDGFIKMCDFIVSTMKDLNTWGMDQLLINYYLYKNGFIELDKDYNFIPTTHLGGFSIKRGVFYFKDGKKIAVVHNAGSKKMFRPIKNFGYGETKNRPKYFLIYLLRIFYNTASFLKR